MAYAGISIGDMYFNAIVSSSHSLECTLAQHTLENGVTVTDHVILNPRKLSVSVDISNALGDKNGSGAGTWPIRALQAIEKAWRNREPFTVITHHGIYDNMVIESGTFTENDVEAGRLTGQISLQQLMFSVIQVGQNDKINPNALPGTREGIAAMPETDSGILLSDPATQYDINQPEMIENAANGELQDNFVPEPLPPPDSLTDLPNLPGEQGTPATVPSAPKPSKFPVSFKNGNISFATPAGNETFNRFRTYTSYGVTGSNVLCDVLDINGNPIRSGINLVPGGDNLLRGYTNDIKLNVLDVTPRLPIANRMGSDSVQVCVGAAQTAWPKIMRYD